MKGNTNIYFKHITLFEKKLSTEKNKIFVEIIHIFYFIFRIVSLHLNNHNNPSLTFYQPLKNNSQSYAQTKLNHFIVQICHSTR